ncbi:MAG TPA: ubiquinone-dependent pyruvate dehydrogenase [Beutenbergiaceae bacterium]|nr:ubiquinone-dependent pyruvate dehydrogenase [Beutenbergiaceae bacterium]
MVSIAQNIVDTLEANGVERIYGIAGDSLNGLTEALRSADMDWMHVRHEEAAGFAAAAEAATTGKLAVAAGSCGPGNMHLINGLYDAHRSRVPVLAIAAQIPSAEIGSNYFQETDPVELFSGCSVYAENVSTVEQMPRALRIAMQEAISKQGVAVLVIPGDVALAEALDDSVTNVAGSPPKVVPADDDVQRAADLLNAGKDITILAGAGVAGAHEDVIALADTLGAPMVHALRGKEHIEWDNPFDVGMTGLLGFASGYKAMMESDTLLMLGTDLPYQQFYPEKATIIQVDIRGENLGRRTPLDLGVIGDVGETARALAPLLKRKRKRDHLDDALKHYHRTREKMDDLAVPSRRKQAIHPQYLTRLIDQHATDDAVFIPDVGSPVTWAARYVSMNGRRRLIGSFAHGSMANALPQGIGVQAAFPDRQVIALAGDGGLSMLLGEMLTLIQHQLPVKVVVYNNDSLNFVELEMKAAGLVNFGTGLAETDFSAVARSMGIHGVRVDYSADLEDAVQEFLAHDGPAVLDVRTERQEISLPPTITAEQARGFTLYAIRTVMSGKGDELLDLARANLRRIF